VLVELKACAQGQREKKNPANSINVRINIGDRSERPCYLSRVDHNRKIRSRKQKRDIGKYSFVK
jgi:hypothetical protein